MGPQVFRNPIVSGDSLPLLLADGFLKNVLEQQGGRIIHSAGDVPEIQNQAGRTRGVDCLKRGGYPRIVVRLHVECGERAHVDVGSRVIQHPRSEKVTIRSGQ